MYYVYDGSFDGFLCCVYAHYYEEKAVGIRNGSADGQVPIFEEKYIVTNYTISHRVYAGLRRRLGNAAAEKIFQAFLSDQEDKEMILLRYIALCLRSGRQMDACRTYPEILPVHRMSEKVAREAHRFLGWLRFGEIQGVLYAAYEPEADITCLLMPHFADRLREERFIIHDLRRKKAGVYAAEHWEERPLEQDLRVYKSGGEKTMEVAWQTYFDHIAIQERENRLLQQHYVPLRIWKNLTEKREAL